MYNKLPKELKENALFCLWKYETRAGKKTKVPYQTNGKRADKTNPACYTDFETAIKHLANYDGVGIGIFKPFVAIDIDHCVTNGKLSEKMQLKLLLLVMGKAMNETLINKKQIQNDQSDWQIFENTHEAIFDKETFDIVQRIRDGRRRLTPIGEMPILSGMLFCADCGAFSCSITQVHGYKRTFS